MLSLQIVELVYVGVVEALLQPELPLLLDFFDRWTFGMAKRIPRR